MNKFVIDIQEIRVAVDAVVIGQKNDEKYVLLMKRRYEPFANSWSFPGGFVKDHEELEDAVLRELREETGFESIKSIKKINVYGKVNRDPRKRVISIAFLIESDDLIENSAEDTEAIETHWFKLNEVPLPLAFDHDVILKDALELLKINI